MCAKMDASTLCNNDVEAISPTQPCKVDMEFLDELLLISDVLYDGGPFRILDSARRFVTEVISGTCDCGHRIGLLRYVKSPWTSSLQVQ